MNLAIGPKIAKLGSRHSERYEMPPLLAHTLRAKV
jgi:hypothetical protein